MDFLNMTTGLASNTETITDGTTLLNNIFNGTQFFSIGFIFPLLLVFISIIFITRNTQKWLDISAPMVIVWGTLGLNIPFFIIIVIALIWTISQIGIKNTGLIMDSVTNRFKEIIYDINPNVLSNNKKSLITQKRYEKVRKNEITGKSKDYLSDIKIAKNLGLSLNDYRNKIKNKTDKQKIEDEIIKSKQFFSDTNNRFKLPDYGKTSKLKKSEQRRLSSRSQNIKISDYKTNQYDMLTLKSNSKKSNAMDILNLLPTYSKEDNIINLKNWNVPKTKKKGSKIKNLKKDWNIKNKSTENRRNEEYYKKWKKF